MADYTIEKLKDADGNNFAFRDPTKATPTDITNAINALDVSDSAVTNQFVTKVSETDGKISVSRAQPQISDVKDLQTALDGKADSSLLDPSQVLTPMNVFADNAHRGPTNADFTDAYWGLNKRYEVELTRINADDTETDISSDAPKLFDGNYDTYVTVPAQCSLKIHIQGNPYIIAAGQYPYGRYIVTFYNTNKPSDVTMRVYENYSSSPGWKNISPTKVTMGSYVMYVFVNNFYKLSEIEINVIAKDSGNTLVSSLLFAPSRGIAKELPFVNKYGSQTLLYDLTAPNFVGNLDGKLKTPRSIQTNLASTAAATFDGSSDITPGVTGILPITNGGTGNTDGKAAKLNIPDTRDTNKSPYWYITNHPQSVVTEFKRRSVIGLTGKSYTYLTTITPWRNNSGGEPFQTAQIDSKRYIRYGLNDDEWSDWEELETVSHVSSTYATKSELTTHTSNTSNPHNVTKSQVGLGNVDNTSDLNKPISTATQTALNLKADKSEIPDVSGKENTSNKVTTLDNSTTHYPSTSAVTTALSGKQDTISDIATIRSNAENGQTAYGWGDHANAGYLTEADLSGYAKTDGSNASGTWAKYSEGIDGHYKEHGTHTYLKLGTITGNYNIYAGLVFVVNIRQNNTRNDTGILTIRKYEYGNDAVFGDTANTSNFVVLDARNPTVTPRAKFYTVSNVSGNTATIDLYVDCNVQMGISLLTCPKGVTWTPNQQIVSSIPTGAETVPSYRAALTNRTAATGSPTQPVYVDESGQVTACGFSVKIVSSIPSSLDANTLYVV